MFCFGRMELFPFQIKAKVEIESSLQWISWLGVKRVTEPNRTEPPDYTGQSLRKFPIVAVPGFTAATEPNQRMRCVSCYFSIISFVFFSKSSFARFIMSQFINFNQFPYYYCCCCCKTTQIV